MSSFKDKVDEVINTQGGDVTVRTVVFSSSRDAWGKPVVDSTSDRTIKAVKDSYLKNNYKMNQSGRMDGATLTLVVKGDETFDKRTDTFVFDGKEYNILQDQPLEKSGEVLAKQLALGEK